MKKDEEASKELVPVVKVLPPVERTAEGLRDALFDELNILRTGETTTKHSRALANVARLIIETAKLEFQQIKLIAKEGEKIESLRLGRK